MIKKDKTTYFIILLCLISTSVFSNSFIRLDSISLANAKMKIENGTASPQTLIAYKKLIKDADKLLTRKNPTVTDKTILPPTGNKHDYLSISRYWWPNPDTKDGLPWVRYDGKTNPETQTDAVDRPRFGAMGRGTWILSLAYYFTEDEIYAEKAISRIETWFINPETLMNPHLEFAQSVPGNPNRRPSGILDGRSITMFLPDALQLLSTSEHWDDNHQTKMNTWLSDYLVWLTESELGIKGSHQKNNHGSWYKFQVASLAYYLGKTDLVKSTIELAQKSLDQMLDEKGRQTHELARSRSFFYSCFNLQALTNIAVIGDKIGIDMWHYKSENKKSLTLAIDYLTPVINGQTWHHNTLKAIDYTGLIPILSIASKNENYEDYKDILTTILKVSEQKKPNQVLFEYWLFL